MIDNWPEAGAVVGAVGIIAGATMRIFSGNDKKEDANTKILLRNQQDMARILERLTMLFEHRETRTEELHKDNAGKLEEITTNQRDIHRAIIDVGHRLARGAI